MLFFSAMMLRSTLASGVSVIRRRQTGPAVMASIRRIKEAAAFQVGLSKSSNGIDSPDLYGCGGGPHESHACVESSQTYIKKGYRSYKRHPEYNFRLHGFLLPRKMRHLLVRLDIRKIRFNSATFLPKKKRCQSNLLVPPRYLPLWDRFLFTAAHLFTFSQTVPFQNVIFGKYQRMKCFRVLGTCFLNSSLSRTSPTRSSSVSVVRSRTRRAGVCVFIYFVFRFRPRYPCCIKRRPRNPKSMKAAR